MSKYGVFRRNAQLIPMKSDRLLIPEITDDLTVYCPGEGNTITESDMTFGQRGLTPKKLACLAKISSELEDDGIIALGEVVGQSMARSMARKEDEIGFLGDGTSTYFAFQGIAGALLGVDETIGNIKSLVVGSGKTYAELTLADFRKVAGQLPAGAENGAKWYLNKHFFWNVVLPLLWAETDSKPTIGTPEFFMDGPKMYLFGYPVEFTSVMPKAEADSQICTLLGNLSLGCYLGQRKELTVEHSRDVYFANDQIGIRGIERIAVNCFGVGDTTNAGVICGLITAAA
jgi:HK97 family phage major capsid protein